MANILSPRIYNLAITLRRATNLEAKRKYGLEREAWRVLVRLGAAQPISLGALADHISLDHGQLSREIGTLVKIGLVHRRRQWRHVHLSLTPKGEALYHKLLADAHARNERLLDGVPDADRQLVLQTLDRAILIAREQFEVEKALEANSSSVGNNTLDENSLKIRS